MTTTPAHDRPVSKKRRALSLMELLLSLVILTLISTAVTGLVIGTMKSNAYIQSQATAISEVDLALTRIVYNLRTADAIPTWGTVGGFSTLSIVKTGVGTVTYHVNANGDLVESDPRYNVGGNPNVLIHGLGASGFLCNPTPPSASQTTTIVAVDLVMPAQQIVERHVKVSVRGF